MNSLHLSAAAPLSQTVSINGGAPPSPSGAANGSIEVGKPANFVVLDANSAFEGLRHGADVLASIRNGEHLFKRPGPRYGIALDLFSKTK